MSPPCHHYIRDVNSTLIFAGHVAAPGYGQSFTCSNCPRTFLVVGDRVIDNDDREPGDYELSIEDVI